MSHYYEPSPNEDYKEHWVNKVQRTQSVRTPLDFDNPSSHVLDMDDIEYYYGDMD